MKIKNKNWIRLTTSIVIISLLYPNMLLAQDKHLAPKSNKKGEMQAVIICETIEKRARYGRPIERIYLDDILKWAESSEEEFSGYRFETLPHEIKIHLPSSNTIVRYFNPSKTGSISGFKTKIIGPRLHRQIIHTHGPKALLAEKQDFKQPVTKNITPLSLLIIITASCLLISTFVFTFTSTLALTSGAKLLFSMDIVRLLPSFAALLGGFGIGWWILRQIEYGMDLLRKEPAYDLLSRIVPPMKEKPKKPIKFTEYRYKVITNQPIEAITLGIKLSDSDIERLRKLSSIEDNARRYMLYYGTQFNKLAGIVTVREMTHGIILVEVEWTSYEGKRQLSEDFMVTELANRNPAGILFYSADIDPEIIDRVLPNHSVADKKESARRLKEKGFSRLKIDDKGQYTFFAMDKQDFKERRRFYFGSFRFSSLWRMAEIDHWIYSFANGLFFALVFSSIFAHAEAIKVLAEYSFFEEYINLILTVIVAPLAARSIAKVIRMKWDPVRSRHGRRRGEDTWLSITQNMRMGWKMIGTFKFLAYSRIFLSGISLLLIPAIGVVILGISSAYVYLSLMFLKLVSDRIINEYEERYYKEVSEVAILFNEAAKREGYAENFHNIDSTSDILRELIYASALLIGYGIFTCSILSPAAIPLAILAAITMPISSFLVPTLGRDYKNYLKMWGKGFTRQSGGRVLLAEGIIMATNPDNPLVVHPRPVSVTDSFSILPWVEQLGVVIECAPGHKPAFKLKNPRGPRAKKGRYILEWPNEKLKIELISREKPIDIRDVVVEHKPDGGCIIRFYPNKTIKPSKGSSATLLQYMHTYGIFSNNPKRSREMARQRGGNDSLRTIQRELKVLKAVGLVEGDRDTGYYLPDWLKSIKIEDIIKENPELNIANSDKKQIEVVKRRIRSRSQTALFTMLNGVLRDFMPMVNASLVAVVLRHYPHKDISFAERLYDVIQRYSGLSSLEKLQEFNRLYPDDSIDNISALAAEANELKKTLSSKVGISSTGQKLLELFQHDLAFTISVDYPDYIKEVMGSNSSLLNAQGLLVDTLGNTREADYDKFSHVDKVLSAYPGVKNVFLMFDTASEIKQARKIADRLKPQGKRVHVIGVVYPMSSTTVREALKTALKQAGYTGGINLDTLNLPDQSFESLSKTLKDAGADIVLSGLSSDLSQVIDRLGKLTDSNIIAGLAYQKDKPVIFSLPKNPGEKYHLTVQDDFVSTGIFRDANETPKHMIYVTTASRDEKQIPHPVGMATGIDIDTEGALNLEWVITFDYDVILDEVERFRITQVKNGTPLFAAMGIYIVFGEKGELHGQIKFLWAYLNSKLQDKSDEAILEFFENAPRNLRRTGIGTAISEFLTSFAPIGSRIKFLIVNKETTDAIWKGEIFENTLIGRWWRKLGYNKIRVSPEGLNYVLEKRRLPSIESIWEEPDNLGEYCIKTKDVERRDVPKYGDKDYWPGRMRIIEQDLVNLGVVQDFRKGLSLSRDAFPLFTDMPKEAQDILMQRLSHPYSLHKDILREREPVEALLAAANNEKLDSIIELINRYSEVKDEYYKELRRLRTYHYPHKYFEGALREFSEPYPEVSQALIYLGQIIVLLSELYKILPESDSPIVQRWKKRIQDTLSHPELEPFIKSSMFLRHVSNIDNPYVFLKRDELDDIYSRTADWEERAKINEVRLIHDQLGSTKLEALKREFLGLAGELSGLWELHVEAANKMKKGSKGDRHPFLRQFPDGIMKDPLARIVFYSRIAQLALQKGYRFADINQPTGTVNLSSYKNPLIRERYDTTKVVPISVNLGGDRNALLLSGPNMGGKTTTARGIGVAILLTQIGLPVPADNPELAVFKNIYTVFPHPEQLQKGYGYFGTLIKELTELIKKAGEGDLVILDEVPTGTDYKELVAIATVLVEDLIKSGATVIVTGHLKKSFELLAERTGQQPYMHTVKKTDGQVEPDFNLVPGIAKHSYAIELTKKAGFPNEITDLSRHYYRIITEGASSDTIPSPTPLVEEKEEDSEVPEITDNSLFAMVETVVENLYSAENFVFSETQKGIIGQLKTPLAGLMVEKFRDLQLDSPLSLKEFKEYSTARLRITNVFLRMGISYLDKMTEILSAFKKFKKDPYWMEPGYNHSENMRKIDLMEGSIKKLLTHLRVLENDPRIGEIITFLDKSLGKLTELRERYKDKNGAGLGKEELKLLNSGWNYEWSTFVDDILPKLYFIDEYTGIAKGIIKHKLKKPVFSDKPCVFSLRNSKPMFPNYSYFSRYASPFIDKAVNQSFQINPDNPILVLTGPNSSGKTVLMFNSYINALFAMCGFYVSGDLEMSSFDNILAFFGGRNEVTSGESYFLNILNRYAEIINEVTPNSLVILDELHGTDNFELAAIQLAVLHYLRRLNVVVIFNTHIRDGLKLAAEKIGLNIWQTDVEYNPKEHRVKPKFTVSPDPELSAKSYGLVIAEQWLSSDQVRRAREIFSLLDPEDPNVSCGTICESGHEGSYNALDEQLKRQFEELRKISDITEEKDLTEEEADRALVEYAKRFGIEVTYEKLQEFRKEIKAADEAFTKIEIFFSIPETGTELFWVGNDYAGGHFNGADTRIHISLPIILKWGIQAGIDIAKHELQHIKNSIHLDNDQGSEMVRKIATIERFKKRYGQEILRKIHGEERYRLFADKRELDINTLQEVIYEREMRFCEHILDRLITILERANGRFGRERIFVINTSMLYDVDETIGTFGIGGWHIRPSIPFLFRFLRVNFNIKIGIASTRGKEYLDKQLQPGYEGIGTLAEISYFVDPACVYNVFTERNDLLHGRFNTIFPGFKIFDPKAGLRGLGWDEERIDRFERVTGPALFKQSKRDIYAWHYDNLDDPEQRRKLEEEVEGAFNDILITSDPIGRMLSEARNLYTYFFAPGNKKTDNKRSEILSKLGEFGMSLSDLETLAKICGEYFDLLDKRSTENNRVIDEFTKRISDILGLEESRKDFIIPAVYRLAAAKDLLDKGVSEVSVTIDNVYDVAEGLYELFIGKHRGPNGEDGFTLFGLDKYRDRLFIFSTSKDGMYSDMNIVYTAEKREVEKAFELKSSLANNPIKALLFDLDGTLMPSVRDISFRALAWSYAKYILGNTEAETVEKAYVIVAQTRERIAREQGSTATVSAVRDALGITLEQQKEGKRVVSIPKLREIIKRDEEQIRLFERLNKYYKLGVVTNLDIEMTEYTLNLLGLRHFFSVIITPEEVGKKKKPDPIFLRTAAERLGVPCGQCVSIGDLYPQDGKPAHELGMHYIEVNNPLDLISSLEPRLMFLIDTILHTERFIDAVKSIPEKNKDRKIILTLDTDIGNMTQFEIDELLRQIRDVSSLLGDIEFVAGTGNSLTGLIDDAKSRIKTHNIDVIVVTKKKKEDFDSSYHVVRTDDGRLDSGSYVPILELLTFALLINLEDNDVLLREIYKELTGNELTSELKGQIKNGISAIPLPPSERIFPDFYNTSIEVLKSA